MCFRKARREDLDTRCRSTPELVAQKIVSRGQILSLLPLRHLPTAMQELLNALRELHIALIGLGLILGVISLKKADKSLLWIFLWPIIFAVG